MPSKTLQLWPQHPIESGPHLILRALLASEGQPDQTIWYQVPRRCKPLLTDQANPFLLAALPIAMRAGTDLHIRAPVSSALLTNLERFQTTWSMWWQDLYQRIEIRADAEEDLQTPTNARAIVAFSGGVDSSFTVYRHKQHLAPSPFLDIEHGLIVHGFDIPLRKPAMFARALCRARAMLDSLDIPLISIATNLREHGLDWGRSYGVALASALSLFAGAHTHGIIASSFTHPDDPRYGSDPETDYLLSSPTFQIVHDGAEHSKFDKVRVIQHWPAALKHLRVCWQGRNLGKNCCKCEKCIRTILFFRALGVFPPAFARDVRDRQIARMRIPPISASSGYTDLLQYVLQNNMQASWVEALEGNLERHRQ